MYILPRMLNFGPINILVVITNKRLNKVRFFVCVCRQAATNSFLILRDRGLHTNPLFLLSYDYMIKRE